MDFPSLSSNVPQQKSQQAQILGPPASQASKKGKGRKRQQQQAYEPGPVQKTLVSQAQTWGPAMFQNTSSAEIEAQRAELNRIEASHSRGKQKPLATDNEDFPGLPQAESLKAPMTATVQATSNRRQ